MRRNQHFVWDIMVRALQRDGNRAIMVLCRDQTLRGVNVLLAYQVRTDAVRSHGLTTNEKGSPHAEQTSGCSSLFS